MKPFESFLAPQLNDYLGIGKAWDMPGDPAMTTSVSLTVMCARVEQIWVPFTLPFSST